MSTPILTGLKAHLSREKASFHMPGHKGHIPPVSAAFDVTEVSDTGDLFAGADFIETAEALWCKAWGMKCCQFLTGGSTQGLHAALLLARRRGRGILVDRASHRSVYNALGLLDFSPTYLLRSQQQPITPTMVEEALKSQEDIKTLCITSPTYYGTTSDLQALSRYCKQRDILLVVDGAHGCHLPFLLEENPFRHAGLVVSSAHKTLPVWGQGAVMLAGEGAGYDEKDLRWAASVVGSSSPSYLILLALDRVREEFSSQKGRKKLKKTVEKAEKFRGRFRCLPGSSRGQGDPMRVVLGVDRGKTPDQTGGRWVQEQLEQRGIYPEMADGDHVIFLFSPNNTAREYRLLWKELEKLEKRVPGLFALTQHHHVLPQPEVVVSPREAMTARRVLSEGGVEDCVGEISAQQIAPYPPGVPIIAPGERITEKTIAFLREIGYNDKKPIELIR